VIRAVLAILYRWRRHVGYVQAAQGKEEKNARIPEPHRDEGRKERAEGTEKKGEKADRPMRKRIRLLLKEGVRRRSAHFLLYRRDSGEMKIGFFVSRANGSACVRSRVKRIVRQWCRSRVRRGDLLFRLRGDCSLCARNVLEAELAGMWGKAA